MDPLITLATTLAKAGAPILGGALGGPVGAALATTIVGALSDAFGVAATPEAVNDAIQSNPQGAEIARQVETAKAPAVVDELNARIAEINQTARLELQSESWFVKHARPANIWVIALVTGGYGVCLVGATVAAVFFKDAAALNLLVTNAGVLGIALAPSGAVAGVSAWGRTQEKLAGVSTIGTAVAGAVASAMKGGRK